MPKSEEPKPNTPVSISEFRNNVRPVSVDWFGQQIAFRYKPNALDDEHYKHADEEGEGDGTDWSAKWLARVLTSIDSLCEDSGDTFDISDTGLLRLAPTLRVQIIKAINNDFFPPAAPEKK